MMYKKLLLILFSISMVSSYAANDFSQELNFYLSDPQSSINLFKDADNKQKASIILSHHDHHHNEFGDTDRKTQYIRISEAVSGSQPTPLTPQDVPSIGELIFDACKERGLPTADLFYLPAQKKQKPRKLVYADVFIGSEHDRASILLRHELFDCKETEEAKEMILEALDRLKTTYENLKKEEPSFLSSLIGTSGPKAQPSRVADFDRIFMQSTD